MEVDKHKQVMFNIMGKADDYIGNGTHKFDDFALKMVYLFGHWIMPYLKLIYNGYRNFPINHPDIVRNMDTLMLVRNFKLKSLFTFKLEADDYLVIELTRSAMQKLLARPGLKSQEIVGIGNFLYLLEKLPCKTIGAQVTISINYEIDSDESTYAYGKITFGITDEQFYIIMKEGEFEDLSVKEFSDHRWVIGSIIEGVINCELETLKTNIKKAIDPNHKLEVFSSSEIDFKEIGFIEFCTLDEA